MPDMEMDQSEEITGEGGSPRFPIRWRWTLLVGGSVALAVALFALIILDLERDAWLESQTSQAETMVERLGDELKLPMLAGSTAEIDTIANSYIKKVPSVLGMHLRYTKKASVSEIENPSTMAPPARKFWRLKSFRAQKP